MSGSIRPCGSIGLPHGLRYARPYPCGWRCEKHTPAAEQGKPEPPPGPGWPAGSYLNPPSDSQETTP
ncbi:hypothetical protein [Streptomyces niveus]|uniref:hypothetical protein n=1 Tax=Streptomyces niveus TaxID=193462 RepID=UPI0033B241B4